MYFVWAIIYYFINFHFKTKKIEERDYKTLFRYFSQSVPWSKKIIDDAGPNKSPYLFMGYHCVFFTVSHLFALMSFYSNLMHTFLVFLWLGIGVWNGGCFYVKFFEYTKQLSYQQKQSIKLMKQAMEEKQVSEDTAEEKQETSESDQLNIKKNQ